jgi:hypothetical protein
MPFTEKEIKKLIEYHIIKKLGLVEDRTLLRLPNNNGGDALSPMGDDPNAQPPMDGMEQPPMEGEDMEGAPDDMGDENMEGDAPPTIDDPNIAELVDLLQANSDKAEAVLKYAKGIIGDTNQQPPVDQGGEEMPPPDNGLPESRNIDLDEMISDIMENDKNKNIKSTISRPILPMNTMKSKMFGKK